METDTIQSCQFQVKFFIANSKRYVAHAVFLDKHVFLSPL
jgi:hypothetical protein